MEIRIKYILFGALVLITLPVWIIPLGLNWIGYLLYYRSGFED